MSIPAPKNAPYGVTVPDGRIATAALGIHPISSHLVSTLETGVHGTSSAIAAYQRTTNARRSRGYRALQRLV